MAIGRVIDPPAPYSRWALVEDQYGMPYTVHASNLPEDVEMGDELAYRVSIFPNQDGVQTTLQAIDMD